MKWIENGVPAPKMKLKGVSRLGNAKTYKPEDVSTVDPPEYVKTCLNCTLGRCYRDKSPCCPLNLVRPARKERKFCDGKKALAMYGSGATIKEIASAQGVTTEAVRYHLKKAGAIA